MAGDNPNIPRQELWDGPINRSFDQPDGIKRIDDLLTIIRPINTNDGEKRFIFPGEDDRVLRVMRKIIRGLAHHHELYQFVPDEKVWVDIQKREVPEDLIEKLSYHHREPDIAEYWYDETNDDEINSAWFIRFFEVPSFVGLIYK